jgi:hypothetical protein
MFIHPAEELRWARFYCNIVFQTLPNAVDRSLMTAMQSSIHLGGMPLGNYRHICAFFNTPEEEYRALLPFISEGIKTGDRAFHVLDPQLLGEHGWAGSWL